MEKSTKNNALDFKFVNYNRIGAIVFMVLVNLLLFFGYICNYYGEEPINESLIWYYQLFFEVKVSKTILGLSKIPVLPLILIFIGFWNKNLIILCSNHYNLFNSMVLDQH